MQCCPSGQATQLPSSQRPPVQHVPFKAESATHVPRHFSHASHCSHDAPAVPHAAAFVAVTHVSPSQQPTHVSSHVEVGGGVVAGVAQKPVPSRIRPLQHGLLRFGAPPALVHASLRSPLPLRFLPPRPRCDSVAIRSSPPLLCRSDWFWPCLPPLRLPGLAAASPFWPSSVPPRSVPITACAAARRERDVLKSRVKRSNAMSSSAGILLVTVQHHLESRSSGYYASFGPTVTPKTRSAFPTPRRVGVFLVLRFSRRGARAILILTSLAQIRTRSVRSERRLNSGAQ
jgi:hypothetical protein